MEELAALSAQLRDLVAAPVQPPTDREKSPRKRDSIKLGKVTPRNAAESPAMAAAGASRERAERAERAALRSAEKHDLATRERAEWLTLVERLVRILAVASRLVKEAVHASRQQGRRETSMDTRREQAER